MSLTMTLNGAAIDTASVEFNTTIMHGRSTVTDVPTASSAQLVIRGAAGPVMEISDTLVISFDGQPRFTGKISDIDVSFTGTNPPTAITTITGMGNLAELGLVDVGASGYAEETVRQRVEAILAASGVTYLNAGDANITVKAVPAVDAIITTAWDGIAAMAVQSGATFFDTPSGEIIFEDYGNRGQTTLTGIWALQAATWASTPGTWASIGPGINGTTIDGAGIILSPTWTKQLEPLINDITVTYGTDQSTQQTDSASIALYGRREYLLDTTISNVGDAVTRTGQIILAQSNPLWNLGQISILVNLLDAATTTAVMKLISGSLLRIYNLPAQGPYYDYTGIVEGWADSYNGGNHTLTLSISDPRFSYQILKWADVIPSLPWGSVYAEAQWFEIVSNNDLVGV
jgi:hypothetical protein